MQPGLIARIWILVLLMGCATGNYVTGSRSANAHYDRAIAFYSKGLLDDAIEEYQMAIHENPRLIKAHFGLGVAYIRTKFYRGAVLALTEALDLEPKFPEASFNLGIAQFHLKKYDLALKHLEAAFAQNPDLKGIHFSLAQAYDALGQSDRAIQSYKNALKADADLRAHEALATLYRYKNDPQNAIKHYRAAAAIDTSNYDIKYKLGILYQSQRDTLNAVRTFQSALSLRPDNLDLGFRLSALLIDLRAYQEALDLYHLILEHHKNARVHFNLGILYDHLRNPTSAIASYRQAISLDPNFADAHLNLAIDQLQQKQYKEALKAYEKFLKTTSNASKRAQVQEIVSQLRAALALPE